MFPVGSLFRLRVSHHLGRATFPAPASSNAACGFPALRSPVCFASRIMGPLSLRLDVYSPPQVLQIDGRLCHLVLAFLVVGDFTNSRAPSLHGRYPASTLLRTHPSPSRLRSTPRLSRLYDRPCSGDFAPGRGGLLQFARYVPCHRAVAYTPPKRKSRIDHKSAPPAAFAHRLRTRPSGLRRHFRGHFCVQLVVTAPVTCCRLPEGDVVDRPSRVLVSRHPAIPNYGASGLLPRQAFLLAGTCQPSLDTQPDRQISRIRLSPVPSNLRSWQVAAVSRDGVEAERLIKILVRDLAEPGAFAS